MEKKEAARQGSKVMSTGGKGGQKLEAINEKAAGGKNKNRQKPFITSQKETMNERCRARYLMEEYIRVGDEMREKKGQPSFKGRKKKQAHTDTFTSSSSCRFVTCAGS